jgi:NADPH-dependent curcumin reductase CurA
MFDTCVDAIAPRGRLIIIGMMSQYGEGWQKRQYSGIAEKLLWKSATLQGFFLLHYAAEWRRHLKKLAGMVQTGQLRVQVGGQASRESLMAVHGLHSVADSAA